MIIEKITSEDIPFIRNLQPSGWPDIVPAFKFYFDNRSWCNPVKVKIDNHLVGVGCSISFKKSAWLAHIIVDPNYQKQGIGLSIVNHLRDQLKSGGVETVSLIATEFGYPVYKKAGFIEETEYLFFEKDSFLPNNVSENIVKFTNQNIKAICSLDRIVSGEERSVLIKSHVQSSYLYMRNSVISGFYFPNLGEGLIVATDTVAGIELLNRRCTSVNKAVLPINNLEAIQFLKDKGFKETNRAKRMILGNFLKWKPGNLFNRIGGNFG